MVNRDILLNKPSIYGIQTTNFKWFKSYLSQRKQYISSDQYKTDALNITCGVPQGSIIRPLLFLIYVKNISLLYKVQISSESKKLKKYIFFIYS